MYDLIDLVRVEDSLSWQHFVTDTDTDTSNKFYGHLHTMHDVHQPYGYGYDSFVSSLHFNS